jgi:hypothetical protein
MASKLQRMSGQGRNESADLPCPPENLERAMVAVEPTPKSKETHAFDPLSSGAFGNNIGASGVAMWFGRKQKRLFFDAS